MAEPTPVNIVDLISTARAVSISRLLEFFESEDLADAAAFPKTVSVMTGMHDEFAQTIALPIIAKFFNDYGIEPTDREARPLAAAFDEVIATNIGTASQVIMQQVQQREISRQKLMQGVLR